MKNFFFLSLLIWANIVSAQLTIPQFLTSKDNFCVTSGTFQGAWQLIGPKSFTTQYIGRIEAVWVDPDDINHILAASGSGGLFEWTSLSTEWTPKTNKLPGIGIDEIAVYKGATSNTIVLATETNNRKGGYGWGLFYSTDNGSNWSFDQDFYNHATADLATAYNATPKARAVKFIPNTNSLVAISRHYVLTGVVSSWSDISPSVSSNVEFIDLEVKIASNGALIIWVVGHDTNLDTYSLYYTTNGGGLWNNVSLPTPNWINVSLPSATDAYVYYFNSGPDDGWINHYSLSGNVFNYVGQTHPGRYGTEFEVSPADNNVMYSAGHWNNRDFWKSINGGSNFSEIYTGIYGTGDSRHVDIRALLLYSATTNHTSEIGDNDKIFIGNDGGLSKTINPTTTSGVTYWTNLNQTGLAVTQFWGFSGVEEQPKLLYGGAQDNHTFKLNNGSPSFTYSSGDGYGTESYQNSSGDVIVFYQYGSGYSPSIARRKTDGLSDDVDVEPSLATSNRKLDQPLYKYSNTSGDQFYLGANDLFISTNDGTSYLKQNLDANTIPFNQGMDKVTAIDVSATDQNKIYVAFNGSGTYNDKCRYQLYFHSSSWSDVTPGYPSINNNDYPTRWNPITGIAMDPDNYNHVWITLDGFAQHSPDGNLQQYNGGTIWHSENAGTSWQQVSTTGLPNFPIECIAYQRGTDDILYVGTDAGIFRWVHSGATSWDGYWECFSTALPAALISDLEINYCAGKLRAATWGRGIWESDLYPQTLQTPEAITTQTWSTSQKRIRSIIINSGNTLTINSSAVIDMCANTYIKIMPGGKLVVNNATLTNSCGYMWSGVQVVGNPNSPQNATSQGTLIMQNGAKIENAYVGVLVDEAIYTAPDYAYPNAVGYKGGGVVQIDQSSIVQCRSGLKFSAYPAPAYSAGPNVSYITRSTFTCNGLLNTPNPNYTNEFISLYDVHGVTILGNTWNGYTGAPVDQRGLGISTYNADFSVIPYGTTSNTFNNAYRGIYALVGNPTEITGILNIDQNVFNGCSRNIYLSGYVNNPIVTRNTCNLTLTAADTTYGIYASACNYYSIQENNITGQSQPLSYGIIVNNSGPYDNYVYKNFLTSLKYGCVSKGQNAGGYTDAPNVGLQFKCNVFTTVFYNIAVFPCPTCSPAYDGTIRRFQGICDGTTTGPAGNQFISLPGGAYSLWKQNAPNIIYRHHNNSPYLPPANILNFALSNCGIAGIDGSCPSLLGGGGGSFAMKSSIASSSSEQDSLLGLIDGGNTQKLLDQIADASISSTDLAGILADASPYLSDTVLKSVLDRTPAMNNADLESVITANSPLSDQVDELLSGSNSVVANDVDVMNAESSDEPSAMELLENEIANVAMGYNLALNNLIAYYLENENSDSALNYLLSINENYRALPFAIQLEEFDVAQKIIDEMPTASDNDINLHDYFQLVLDQTKNGKSLDTLSSDQIDLVSKWADKNSIVGYYALNLLSYIKGQTYFEDIPVIADEDDGDQRNSQEQEETSGSSALRLIPNPATKEVRIEISGESLQGSIKIDVFDAFGKLVRRISVADLQKEITLDLSGLRSGVYAVLLKSGAEVQAAAKLIVAGN